MLKELFTRNRREDEMLQIAEDAFDNSEVFFECLNGGPVMTYLQRKGFPVHLTYDGLWNN